MFFKTAIIYFILILQLQTFAYNALPLLQKRDQAGVLRPITAQDRRLLSSTDRKDYSEILDEIFIDTILDLYHSIPREESEVFLSILPDRKKFEMMDLLAL